jgi:glycosyltransferase involved in cell wall biosynthesis
MLASIIIDNFNYERYLSRAIESALKQTYGSIEVIVVDDGSTDASRAVIHRYDGQITPVLKENGGQASAFNAGYAVSQGDVVSFLDADDVLLPETMERAVQALQDPDVAKVHWPLYEIDEWGKRTGGIVPWGELPSGDLHSHVVANGPDTLLFSPTSGNVWARRFLQNIFPVPEVEYRMAADAYLGDLAPFFGKVERLMAPAGLYRIHGRNHHTVTSFEDKVLNGTKRYERVAQVALRHCLQSGFDVDANAWEENSWFCRLKKSLEEIKFVVPPGGTFILVDEDSWEAGSTIASRGRYYFPEKQGRYWGRPEDDEAAILELERLRCGGAEFAVFAWPALWWLEFYVGFFEHLRARYPCILQNDLLVIFDLRQNLSSSTL